MTVGVKTPNSYKDITTEQAIKAREVICAPCEFEIEKTLDKISAVGIDVSEFDLLELAKVNASLKWLEPEPTLFRRSFDQYQLKEWKELTLGEFRDCLFYLKNRERYGLLSIAATLYRKPGEKRSEYKTFERREEFAGVPAANIIGIENHFKAFAEEFISKRKPLFSIPDEDDEQYEESEDDTGVSEKTKQKWSWEHLFYRLAGGDLTKIEAVTELNLFMVFNFLAMKYELKLKE